MVIKFCGRSTEIGHVAQHANFERDSTSPPSNGSRPPPSGVSRTSVQANIVNTPPDYDNNLLSLYNLCYQKIQSEQSFHIFAESSLAFKTLASKFPLLLHVHVG